MSHEIHSYSELKQRIHEDLRSQHPDWIQPSGKCPECDEHEARLKKMLEALAQAVPDRELDQRASMENETTRHPA